MFGSRSSAAAAVARVDPARVQRRPDRRTGRLVPVLVCLDVLI